MQPISRALGPTRFVPFTHTDAEAHAALESHGDVIGLARVPTGERPWRQPGSTDGSLPPRSYVALLQTGDVALYDGRTFHSGGANTMSLDGGGGVNTMGLDGGGGVDTMGLVGDPKTDQLRIIFYATFRHAGRLADAEAYDDPSYRSILAEYAGQHTLGDIMKQTGAVAYAQQESTQK
jgi:hypothetical protein